MMTAMAGGNRMMSALASGRRPGGTGAFHPDAMTLFAAMTSEPDSTRKTLISTTISDLDDAGIWDESDELWFLAGHDDQASLLGWKRYKDCTNVGAAQTPDRGFATDGVASHLDTGFDPLTSGVNYQTNHAMYGFYSRTAAAFAGTDMGASDASGARRSQLSSRWSDNNSYGQINHGGTTNRVVQGSSNGAGLWLVERRSGVSGQRVVRNGASFGTGTANADGLTQYSFYIGGHHLTGNFSSPSARQYSFGIVGGGMTDTQQADLYTIVQAYMTAIGANV